MHEEHPNYEVWQAIDYEPSIKEFLPDSLLPNLQPGQRILEIGCNKGRVALWLAEKGFSVTGIDINPEAVVAASAEAESYLPVADTRFVCGDLLSSDLGTVQFDAVVMIRLLTCIPNTDDWQIMLKRTHALLARNGLIYIHDFLIDSDGTAYKDRYRDGALKGWREGNFAVYDADARLQFVAHHHTQEDMGYIREPYAEVFYKEHGSLSMNGNSCMMFEYIGRKL